MARIWARPPSKALFLGVQTNGRDIWIRLGFAKAIYGVDNVKELMEILNVLFTDRVCFVVVTKDRKWVESTLVAIHTKPSLESKTGTVRLISWSGKHDRKYSLRVFAP